jgi:hypothetical protein
MEVTPEHAWQSVSKSNEQAEDKCFPVRDKLTKLYLEFQ